MVSNNYYISPIRFDHWENWKNKINNSIDNEELRHIAETHSEWYIRALAVNKIDDESILTDIAINNSNSYICDLAVRKIQNDQLLKKIVENSQIYKGPLSQIDDEKLLINFAENGKDYYLRRYAISNIKNENLLVNFVKKRLKYTRKDFENGNVDKSESYDLSQEYSLCEIALEQIHDEALLKDIVTKDYNQSMGIKALNNIYDQEFLIDVALNHYDMHYRIGAIKNITNDEVLINISINDAECMVREAAIPRISNQDIAVKIISNDYGIEVYRINLDHINDDLLFGLVKREGNWIRRNHFVKSIQNTDYLKYVVCNDVNRTVCETAVENIHDESFLIELFSHNFSTDALEYTIKEAALKNIHDESFLKEIFNRTKYGREALKNIKDESFLIPIALNCHDSFFRSEAVENINDEEVLTQIALTDPQIHIRRKAVKKITNDFALINISIMDLGFQEYSRPYCVVYLVRQDAESRLKELIENPEIQTKTEYVDVIQRIRYELNEKNNTSTNKKETLYAHNYKKEDSSHKKRILKEIDNKERKIPQIRKDKKSDSKSEINKLLENHKNDVLVTIAAFNKTNLFKKGSIFNIVKEPDNPHDMEAIAVKSDNKTVAYVANSVHTVVKGTMSAGRLYDKIENVAKAKVIFVDRNKIIAKIVK